MMYYTHTDTYDTHTMPIMEVSAIEQQLNGAILTLIRMDCQVCQVIMSVDKHNRPLLDFDMIATEVENNNYTDEFLDAVETILRFHILEDNCAIRLFGDYLKKGGLQFEYKILNMGMHVDRRWWYNICFHAYKDDNDVETLVERLEEAERVEVIDLTRD